jgi:hypothetical protein
MKEKKASPAHNSKNEKPSSAEQLGCYLGLALNALLEIMGADTGWLQLLTPGGDEPLASACQGCTPEMKQAADSLALREAGRPAETDAMIIPDLSRAADGAMASFPKAGFASLIVVPLRTNFFQGFLGVVSRERAAFDGESAEILKLKASLIGAVLEKGALSRGLADLLAKQAQTAKRQKETKSIVTIAGNQYRKVRQAVEKADKKFTQATINLLKEPGWESLLEHYEGGQPAPAADTASPETVVREEPAPSQAPGAARADSPVEPPDESAPEDHLAGPEAPGAAPAPEDTFEVHSGRIKAFRRSQTNLK